MKQYKDITELVEILETTESCATSQIENPKDWNNKKLKNKTREQLYREIREDKEPC